MKGLLVEKSYPEAERSGGPPKNKDKDGTRNWVVAGKKRGLETGGKGQKTQQQQGERGGRKRKKTVSAQRRSLNRRG